MNSPQPSPKQPASLDWLDDAACADLEIGDFFVNAGHVISEEVLEVCRGCPVRKECVIHSYNPSYKHNILGGYFGGISPGQRREMKLEEALEFIENDKPKQQKKKRVKSKTIVKKQTQEK